ncbi:MAG: DUF2807 domain-containing protein [Pseudomonadota bacterium]
MQWGCSPSDTPGSDTPRTSTEEQPIQSTHRLDDCAQLRLQGEFHLTIERTATPAAELEVRSEQPVAANRVQVAQQSEGVSVLVAPGATPLQLQVRCNRITDVQLLGAVTAQLVDAESRLLDVTRLAVYGASVLNVAGISADALDLRSSGAAQLVVERVVLESLQILAASASRVTVTGDSTRFSLDVTGAAQVNAAELSSQTITVNGRGSSLARVQPSAHLQGQLADTSQLIYTGTPDVSVTLNDAAQIQQQ